MSRVRLSVNERGELIRRDGAIVGSVVGLTVDLDERALDREFVGTIGVEGEPEEKKENSTPGPSEGKLFDSPSPEMELWAHYQATVDGADRRRLDSTRRGILRNALKVRSLEACKRAIDGLAASPYHNGHKQRREKYLDLRYALKGNTRDGESNDARIDKMAAKAPNGSSGPTDVRALLATVPSELREIVMQRMRDVRVALDDTADESAARVAAESRRWLEEHHSIVPLITASDGSLGGWRKA